MELDKEEVRLAVIEGHKYVMRNFTPRDPWCCRMAEYLRPVLGTSRINYYLSETALKSSPLSSEYDLDSIYPFFQYEGSKHRTQELREHFFKLALENLISGKFDIKIDTSGYVKKITLILNENYKETI